MNFVKNKLAYPIPAALLLSLLSWQLQAHREVVKDGRPHYDRSKYYSTAGRGPFTFISRYTLTATTLQHPLVSEVTEAEDSTGRYFRAEKTFKFGSATDWTDQSTYLVEPPDGRVTILYSTKWQEALKKPLLVTYGTRRQALPHLLPENNCTSPERALTYLRNETLGIGEQGYSTAVVRSKNEDSVQTSWFAMNPNLGCLELKSMADYTQPDGTGTTVHEPISLALGEPDAQLLDIADKINATAVEIVPFADWNSVTKMRSEEYRREYQQRSSHAN